MAWSTMNPKKLAIASSDNNIFILEDDGNGFKKTGELSGHQSGVTFVSWSDKSEHKLVSASFDHTVRIWNTQTMECIAWSDYGNKMHCATFLPTGNFFLRLNSYKHCINQLHIFFSLPNGLISDENFIVCSGLSETMHIFEIEKRLIADIGTFDSKKKKKSPNNEVQWGTLHQNEAAKLRSQEKKKLRKLELQKKKSDENVDEIVNSLNTVNLTAAPVKVTNTQI